MKQLGIDIPRARTTDRETSHAAARSVKNITGVQLGVLRCLYNAPPLCDLDLVVRYVGLQYDDPDNFPAASDSGLRTRRKELERKGLVVDTNTTTKLPSGRWATLFMLSEEGRKVVEAND